MNLEPKPKKTFAIDPDLRTFRAYLFTAPTVISWLKTKIKFVFYPIWLTIIDLPVYLVKKY